MRQNSLTSSIINNNNSNNNSFKKTSMQDFTLHTSLQKTKAPSPAVVATTAAPRRSVLTFELPLLLPECGELASV